MRIVFLGFLVCCLSIQAKAQLVYPKNIILVVVDGMGYGQLTAAAMEKGSDLNIYKMKYSGNVLQPESIPQEYNVKANYISSGTKTSGKAIGMDENDHILVNILEIAKEYKKSIGIISTASIIYPSVASFYSHQKNYENEEKIAQDLFTFKPDFIAAGGMKYFSRGKGDDDLLRQFRKEGYKIIDNIRDLEKSNSRKTLALLNNDHLMRSDARGNFLETAWNKAFKMCIKNEPGYFILIELPHIDWAARNNDTRYALEEVIDLDNMIGKILLYTGNDKETLLVVVSNGDTGALSHTGGSVQGKRIEVNWSSKSPVPQMAPVFANGTGAELFSGVYTLDQIFVKLKTLIY